jgi:4-amino-4-deoxychorismate mutase
MSAQDSPASGLEPFRKRLDQLDDQIAQLLGERFDICRSVALYKREHKIPMMQPDRVAQVRQRYLARGADVDLPADFSAQLFELLIGATCKLEDELIDAPPDRDVQAEPVREMVDDAQPSDHTGRAA